MQRAATRRVGGLGEAPRAGRRTAPRRFQEAAKTLAALDSSTKRLKSVQESARKVLEKCSKCALCESLHPEPDCGIRVPHGPGQKFYILVDSDQLELIGGRSQPDSEEAGLPRPGPGPAGQGPAGSEICPKHREPSPPSHWFTHRHACARAHTHTHTEASL